MKITASRSILPWGTPNVKVDMSEHIGEIVISGALHKSVTFGWSPIKEHIKYWNDMQQNTITTKKANKNKTRV